MYYLVIHRYIYVLMMDYPMDVKQIIGGLIGGLVGIVTTPVVADAVAGSDGGNLTGAANTLFLLVPLIWVGVTVVGGIFIGSR